jgi:hypothetical protein
MRCGWRREWEKETGNEDSSYHGRATGAGGLQRAFGTGDLMPCDQVRVGRQALW